MKVPHHVTIDRRALVRLAARPCSSWNWYEVAKAHQCRDLEDLWAVTGGAFADEHMEASMSGFGLYIGTGADAKDCTQHHAPLLREPESPLPKLKPAVAKRLNGRPAPVTDKYGGEL